MKDPLQSRILARAPKSQASFAAPKNLPLTQHEEIRRFFYSHRTPSPSKKAFNGPSRSSFRMTSSDGAWLSILSSNSPPSSSNSRRISAALQRSNKHVPVPKPSGLPNGFNSITSATAGVLRIHATPHRNTTSTTRTFVLNINSKIQHVLSRLNAQPVLDALKQLVDEASNKGCAALQLREEAFAKVLAGSFGTMKSITKKTGARGQRWRLFTCQLAPVHEGAKFMMRRNGPPLPQDNVLAPRGGEREREGNVIGANTVACG